MNRRISGILAAIVGACAVGIYVAAATGSLKRFGVYSGEAVTWFYLLYVAALVLAGQALTGLPAWKLSAAWNGLKGWQRGVIGTAIVAVAFFAWFFLELALTHRGLIDQNAIP